MKSMWKKKVVVWQEIFQAFSAKNWGSLGGNSVSVVGVPAEFLTKYLSSKPQSVMVEPACSSTNKRWLEMQHGRQSTSNVTPRRVRATTLAVEMQ